MKIHIIVILTILFLSSCKKENVQEQTPIENTPSYHTFDGGIGTYDNSTIITFDNNLIICGNVNNTVSIIKITKAGTLLWRRDFEAGNGSSASGITETTEHNLFICGNTYRNYSNTKYDILLIKTNSLGDTIWTKTYGGNENDYGTNIITTSDGNILISAKTTSFGADLYGDIYLIKVNTNGDTIWTRTYTDQDQEEPFHLMETINGEFLLTGTNEDIGNSREIYLLKVSADGTPLWNKKIGPADMKWGFSSIELSNGNLMICGLHTSNGYSQVLLLKTDNLGNVIWEKEYGENNLSENGNSIKQNSDGSFTITGSSYDVSSMQTDIILLKVDQSGNQLWLKKFGSSANDSGINLIKDINDDNIITGYYNGSIFMTKTDTNGIFK